MIRGWRGFSLQLLFSVAVVGHGGVLEGVHEDGVGLVLVGVHGGEDGLLLQGVRP